MATPLDILAWVLADHHGADPAAQARAVADHLADDPVVGAAVAALITAGWGEAGVADRGLSLADLADVARVVLRSVGG